MKTTLLSITALAALAMSAQAAVVAFHDPTGTSSIGVLDASNREWTQFGTTTTLDGNAVTTTVAGGTSGNIGSPTIEVFERYQFKTSGEMVMTISGLVTDHSMEYNLAIFMLQNGFGGRGGLATITTSGVTNPAAEGTDRDNFGTFVEGENYVQFDNIVANTSGEITFTVGQNVDGIAIFNGLEIQSVAVPEPSSSALLGLGCLALILRRRK